MKELSVFIAYQPDPADLACLRERLLPAVKLSAGDELPNDLDFDVLVHGRPDEAWLSASDNLRTLIIPFSGLPRSTADVLAGFPDIKVHNLHHNAIPVAEMAIGLLLAAARRIASLDQQLRRNDWTPRYQDQHNSFLLQNSRVLVLGYGHVGRHVAGICTSMGMEVKGVRKSPSKDGGEIEVYATDSLRDLLPWAQVVIVCLPLTDETRGLIDAEKLSLLPPEAVLVNVGRGEIIDEGALYRALADESIAAAGLDVWFNYPSSEADRSNTPPSEYPFGQLMNVVMTPHVAGKVLGTERLRMEHLADLLNQLAAGGRTANQIDAARGY